MSFAVVPTPPADVTADVWRNAVDFAMANGVICEGSLFLFGNICREHQIKGISGHLDGDLHDLEDKPAGSPRCQSR
jgi:hypothetical protein